MNSVILFIGVMLSIFAYGECAVPDVKQTSCPICQKMYKKGKDYLLSKTTKEEALTFFGNFCRFAPNQEKCLEGVEFWVSMVYGEGYTPLMFCQKHRICPLENYIERRYKDQITCPLCINGLKKLKPLVENEKFVATFQHVIQIICELKSKNPLECNALYLGVLEAIVQSIASDKTNILCKSYKFCRASTYEDVMHGKKPNPEICTFLTGELEEIQQYLRNPEIVKKIWSQVEAGCSYFGVFADKCTTFAEEKLQIVYKYVTTADVQALLKSLQLC